MIICQDAYAVTPSHELIMRDGCVSNDYELERHVSIVVPTMGSIPGIKAFLDGCASGESGP